jgi:hypothetical protein
MSVAFAAPALLAALQAPGPAPEAQIAACAWKQAATSSATLLGKARFDRQYRYDADGSPTVGPLMRIRAACADRIAKVRGGSPFAAAFGDDRKLLKLLRQTRPRAVGPDLFAIPVTRCEYRFTDSPPGAHASAVIWSYGEGDQRKELTSSWETLGLTLGPADMRAITSDKVDPSKLFERLDQIEPVRVATLAEGKASGKPFALDIERGLRSCRRVNSDGSYTDA